MNFNIVKATEKDALTVAGLAIKMWEDNVLEELAAELAEIIGSSESAAFLGIVAHTVDGNTAFTVLCVQFKFIG